MRNVHTRMPFKYGAAVLTAVPILHVVAQGALKNGTPVQGVAADILPPKWFDKDPAKSYEDNVADLLWAARAARCGVFGCGAVARVVLCHMAGRLCADGICWRRARPESVDGCPRQYADGARPDRRGGMRCGRELLRAAQGQSPRLGPGGDSPRATRSGARPGDRGCAAWRSCTCGTRWDWPIRLSQAMLRPRSGWTMGCRSRWPIASSAKG